MKQFILHVQNEHDNNYKHMQITQQHVEKILELLSHGLVAGLGVPEPGKMCIEAAVCYAFNLPPTHGGEVRKFKIGLNDKRWSTPAIRAKGMQKLAIAQLGSDEIDQKAFRDLFWFRCGTQLQPIIWRYRATKTANEAWNTLADKMEQSKTLKECLSYDYGYDYGYGHDYSHDYDYSYGCSYGYPYGYSKDDWYTKVADLAVQVLVELKSPGATWLHLCKPF